MDISSRRLKQSSIPTKERERIQPTQVQPRARWNRSGNQQRMNNRKTTEETLALKDQRDGHSSKQGLPIPEAPRPEWPRAPARGMALPCLGASHCAPRRPRGSHTDHQACCTHRGQKTRSTQRPLHWYHKPVTGSVLSGLKTPLKTASENQTPGDEPETTGRARPRGPAALPET